MTTLTGVLLVNLGTPEALTKKAVRAYLREFLSDPRVIDIPAPLRWVLVNGIILPFRPKQTLHAYSQIWTEQGSPLLIHSEALANKLTEKLGVDHEVALAMRYGEPNLRDAIINLVNKGCNTLKIIPLYPQYASSTTGSTFAKVMEILSTLETMPKIHLLNDFYDHPQYIHALTTVIQDNPLDFEPDAWVFSYHGLPVRQIEKVEQPDVACDRCGPCPTIDHTNRYCYRAQCYATSRLLAAQLALSRDQYHVAFQSRLGRIPWIRPYTDELLKELSSKGIKKLAVVCPSFVADCLETLEEIGIRAKEDWQQMGGSNFALLPCLNSHPAWLDGLAELIQQI